MTHRLETGRLVVLLCLLLSVAVALADDWPEMQGAGRRSVWSETGILRSFPADGLKVAWRTPIGPGYSGPAVAGGRVFVSDYEKTEGGGQERVLCLDEQSGQVLWTYANPTAEYKKFTYNNGPRATPTVDGENVYVQGGAGDVYCLQAATGQLLWHVNLPSVFNAKIPVWGFACAPIVYQGLLICAVNGENARLVGLNKATGDTVWKSLPAVSDLNYSPPILVNAGGVEQLVHWNADALTSVNPATGELYWEQPYGGAMSVATPVVDGDKLLVSGFYGGSMLMELEADRPAATLLWHRKGANEVNTESLQALLCTPVMMDGYIYGICSFGQLRCIDGKTGERVWETQEVTKEKARWAAAFIVRNGDAFFFNNDRGELVIGRLSPEGYTELDRTELIAPTSGGAGGRERKLVNWTLPAYANRHIIIRNDHEIIRVSLED